MISHCTLHIYNLGRQTGTGLRDRTFCHILLYLTEYRDALSLLVEGTYGDVGHHVERTCAHVGRKFEFRGRAHVPRRYVPASTYKSISWRAWKTTRSRRRRLEVDIRADVVSIVGVEQVRRGER